MHLNYNTTNFSPVELARIQLFSKVPSGSPREARSCLLLFAAPSCFHHSSTPLSNDELAGSSRLVTSQVHGPGSFTVI